MTVDENKAIIRRLLAAQERGDIEEWIGLWASDARSQGRPMTPEVLRLVFTSLHTAFPDRHHEIVHLVAEGDLVVSHLAISGAFGDLPPLPVNRVDFLTTAPVGTPYSVPAVHIWRVAEGKIVEHWEVADNLRLLTQLGAIAPPERSNRLS